MNKSQRYQAKLTKTVNDKPAIKGLYKDGKLDLIVLQDNGNKSHFCTDYPSLERNVVISSPSRQKVHGTTFPLKVNTKHNLLELSENEALLSKGIVSKFDRLDVDLYIVALLCDHRTRRGSFVLNLPKTNEHKFVRSERAPDILELDARIRYSTTPRIEMFQTVSGFVNILTGDCQITAEEETASLFKPVGFVLSGIRTQHHL